MKRFRPLYRIPARTLLLVAGFYAFFALLYYTALWINRGGGNDPHNDFFSWQNFANWGGIDYFLKLTLSIPVWWLIFRQLAAWPFYARLLVHCVTLPLFVLGWQKIYYLITEALHFFHLSDRAQVWDTYITSLFYVLQFGIVHAYIYFRQTQDNQKTEAALREAALKSELAALKAQLNPHFLYNVFNTINASVPPELEKTRQMIAELADLFRYQLRSSEAELVPLREEIDFTRQYLDLEKARFEERLRVVIDVDESLMDAMIPPMIIQPLVENAIRHGIAPLIDGGQITIRVQRQEHQLSFCIQDTGKGVADKTALMGKGIGLTNTQLRLHKMYGTSILLTDTKPTGLTVSFIIG